MDGEAETLLEVRSHQSLTSIAQGDWDACACPEAGDGGAPLDPFTTYRFLKALEDSGSVGRGTGWQPHYLTVHKDDRMIAAAPLYIKSHSQGEYIFDFNWAHAYENAGGRYYPKLQIAVPFTPATGRRFLTRPGFEVEGMSALVQGAVQIASDNGVSSLHATFCTEDEAAAGKAMGLLLRASQQFHWVNEGYTDFDGFLTSLSSRKRKNIRKERQQAQDFGGDIVSLTGDDLQPEHWDAFWRFYQDTGSRKWGTPYLTREFFDAVQDTMRDDVLLVLAMRNGQPIAGALNFIGRETLYGRYWGCTEHHPFLHFELCYYQAIDAAIAMGLTRVEAGAPHYRVVSRSPSRYLIQQWFADQGFTHAIEQYLEAEAEAVEEEMEVLTSYGPFRRETREEQD